MKIGILQVELFISDAQSLKDKRRVVKSLKDRLHREHLVAVAEVDSLDVHKQAVLGLALVSNDASHAQSTLDRIVNELKRNPRFSVSDYQTEIISGQ